MFKKAIALILSLSLVLGLIFIPAYATGTDYEVAYRTEETGGWLMASLTEAIDAIGHGTGTIQVMNDIALTEPIEIKGNITMIPTVYKTVTISRGFATGRDADRGEAGDAMFYLFGKALSIGNANTGTLVLDGGNNDDCAGPIIYACGTQTSPSSLALRYNAVLQNNCNTSYGGAIDAVGLVDIDIVGAKFANNTSDKNGGAISIRKDRNNTSTDTATVTIKDTTFVGNTAIAGGAIYADHNGSTLELVKDKFEENIAQKGSALSIEDVACQTSSRKQYPIERAVVIDSCEFQDNTFDDSSLDAATSADLYALSSTVWIGADSAHVENSIVLDGACWFDNETTSDIALDYKDFGVDEKSAVVTIGENYRITGYEEYNDINIMVGAYAVNQISGIDVFKCDSEAQAKTLARHMIHTEDQWGVCHSGDAAFFVVTENGISVKEQTYSLTVLPAEYGTITVDTSNNDIENISAKEEIRVTFRGEGEYRFVPETLSIATADGEPVEYSSLGTSYIFDMPASDVTVTAEFELPGKPVVAVNDSKGGRISIMLPSGYGNNTRIEAGTSVGVYVNADDGYEVERVSVITETGEEFECEGSFANHNTTYSTGFKMPDENLIVRATYKQIVYTITTPYTEYGTITPSSDTASAGTQVVLNVTPDEAARLKSISVTDAKENRIPVEKQKDGSYVFTMPESDVTVNAKFETVQYKVVLPEEPAYSSVTADHETAAMGDTVTVTVVPETDHKASIRVETETGALIGAEKNGDSWSFTMPAGDVTVKVIADKTIYQVTTMSADGGSIEAKANSTVADATVTLIPTADAGMQLKTLIATNGNGEKIKLSKRSDGTYTFKMPASDVEVAATFTAVEHQVNLTSNIGGRCQVEPFKSGIGETVTVTLDPDLFYVVKSVTVTDADGKAIGVTETEKNTYTFEMPATDVALDVAFQQNHFVDIQASEDGFYLLLTDRAVEGQNVNLIAIPNPGYKAYVVAHDALGNKIDVKYNGGNIYSLVATDADVDIDIAFAKKCKDPNNAASIILETVEYGTCEVSNLKAKPGETVTLTCTADAIHEFDSLSICDTDGNFVKVDMKDDGTFSFVMPEDASLPLMIDVQFKPLDITFEDLLTKI